MEGGILRMDCMDDDDVDEDESMHIVMRSCCSLILGMIMLLLPPET